MRYSISSEANANNFIKWGIGDAWWRPTLRAGAEFYSTSQNHYHSQPDDDDPAAVDPTMTDTRAPIALFYGSSTCYTEMAAEKICAQLGVDVVDLFSVADTPLITAEFYPFLVFGIPTWDYGELQEDWEEAWPDIDDLNLNGKKVALFGLGDQIGYPEWFLDAMGYLHQKLIARGATMVGYWPNEGYEFEDSKALTADQSHFVGLALDEENEFDKTPERIRLWCRQILTEFGMSV